ncbi:MAG: hypothetical protein AABZ47_17630, partial [Planctomycetota bacterium]
RFFVALSALMTKIGQFEYFTTTYQYDSLDNLDQISREVDASHNVVTSYEYDASENLTLARYGQANAMVNPQPTNIERWLYDERDLLWHQTRSEGELDQSTTQFDYDGNESLVKVREGLEDPTREHGAHEFTIQRDGFDRNYRTVDPHGNTTQNTFDANHNRTLVVVSGETVQGQSTGAVRLAETQNKFDAWDRKFSLNPKFFRQRLNSFIQDTIDSLSECLTEFDGEGHRRRYCPPKGSPWGNEFDSADRGSLATSPAESGQSSTSTSYNFNSSPDGYVQTDSSSFGGPNQVSVTILERDGLERLTTRINNINDREEFSYDSRNNLVGHTDFNGLFTRYEYDGLNRLVRTIRDMDRDGASAADSEDIINTFTWDDSSRIVSLTDDNGNTTTYTYDPLDRVTAITYADGTQQVYGYNIFGNVFDSIDANGTIVVNEYDKLNRLVSRTVTPGPGVAADTTQVTYKYDGLSRVVFAQDDDSTVVRKYDSYGNVIEETIAFGQIDCGNGIVEPGEECDPPDAGATCNDFCRWTVGNCCTAHPATAGCSHAAIQECVCAFDDYCCGNFG